MIVPWYTLLLTKSHSPGAKNSAGTVNAMSNITLTLHSDTPICEEASVSAQIYNILY